MPFVQGRLPNSFFTRSQKRELFPSDPCIALSSLSCRVLSASAEQSGIRVLCEPGFCWDSIGSLVSVESISSSRRFESVFLDAFLSGRWFV